MVNDFIRLRDLESYLEKKVNEIIDTRINDLNRIAENDKMAVWISTAEITKRLTVSRQTLNSWLRNPKIKPLIEPFVQRGKTNYYDINGIERLLKSKRYLFGGGKEYRYKSDPVVRKLLKDGSEYYRIRNKILAKEAITQEEMVIYEREYQSNSWLSKTEKKLNYTVKEV